MNIGKTGISGEDRVANFLRKKGAVIVKRNYSCRFGEIDIIAEYNEYILFVEVKTRKNDSLISGLEAVDAHKRERIVLTAKDYISKTKTSLQPRFDVACVTVLENEKGVTEYKLKYIKNAF